MNLDDAIGTIISRGFTERQARFLVLVARHSGVCVMRQHSAFAGVVFGHTTRRFFTKLERLGWVSTYDCARKRARIYHVRHRERRGHRRCRISPQASAHRATRARAHHAARRHPEGAGPRLVGHVRGEDDVSAFTAIRRTRCRR